MLQIDHRESHDIDLFLDDPQLLPYLNPETQEIELERRPDSYSVEGMMVLKLAYRDIGEIDFIACADITNSPATMTTVRGKSVAMETPAENRRRGNFQCSFDCVVGGFAPHRSRLKR